MKKIMIIALTIIATLSAQATITNQLWVSLITETSGFGSETGGEGVGWWCEVWNTTDSNYPVMSVGNAIPTVGYTTAMGYNGYLFNTFTFTATETDNVILRLYDASTVGAASNYIESAGFSLPDRESPIGGNDLDVTFDFSSSSWQAVPEPATALLFGVGGMGAWMLRRKNQKKEEEPEPEG